MRMTLREDARVADYDSLAEDLSSYWSRTGNATAIIPGNPGHKLFRMLSDPGRYAALLGYDALDLDAYGELVVFNRTAVRVSATVWEPFGRGREGAAPYDIKSRLTSKVHTMSYADMSRTLAIAAQYPPVALWTPDKRARAVRAARTAESLDDLPDDLLPAIQEALANAPSWSL
ncbi:hypothetical protein GCM10010203_48240 [Actinomadura yumaensis]